MSSAKKYWKQSSSSRKSRHKEGKALRGSAIAYREQFGTPELIELLLHGKAPDNREEEQHPGLQHVARQRPDEPADDAEAGEDTIELFTVKFITEIHEDKRLFGHPCGQEMPISPVTKPVPLA